MEPLFCTEQLHCSLLGSLWLEPHTKSAALMLESSSACKCDTGSSIFLPKRLKTWTVHSPGQDRRDLTRIFT